MHTRFCVFCSEIFILTFGYQALFLSDKWNTDKDISSYFAINFDMSLIKSYSIMISAYGFQANIFPIFNSLKVQSIDNCNKVVKYGLINVWVVKLVIAITGVVIFGT